jgi:subtilisin family serine protease
MKGNRIFLFISALIILLAIPLWYTANQNNQPQEPIAHEGQSKVNRLAVDQVLAEDLSLTTTLFLAQLSKQLMRWANTDFTKPELEAKFKEELKEHRHFDSFALMKDGKVIHSIGNISEENLDRVREVKENHFNSTPYTQNNKQYLLMAQKIEENEWVIGEVDLSFVKQYVGEIGSVADAGGNFFISSGDKEVEWKNSETAKDGQASQEVPEIGWKVVIQSKPEIESLQQKHYKEGEAIIKLSSPISKEQWESEHPEYKVVKENDHYLVIANHSMTTKELIQFLAEQPEVESAEPNYIYTKQTKNTTNVNPAAIAPQTTATPNDEFFQPYQWNLSQIKAERGWEITGGTEDVIIAVLDTGIDTAHQDLADKLIDGYNAFDETSNVTDEHGHGTHVAGITGALTNNMTGIAGVSWYNPIMPVKVLNENGEGSLFEIASGIHWATDHGAKVINLSLGDSESSSMLHDAIKYAYEHDVVLIAAAGNDNVGQPMFPAAYPEVFSVSAVDEMREKAVFSNYGEHIDVAAPGEHIPSTFPDNNYVFMSGTSMAAPHVAGLAGLIRSIRPELNNEEVMELMRQTAEDIGPAGQDQFFGYGEINVSASLDFLESNAGNTLNFGEPLNRYQDWLQGLFNKLFRST